MKSFLVFTFMKFLLVLVAIFSTVSTGVFAQDLPAHCKDNSSYRQNLQALGPAIAVGASGSSGLLATPFPLLAANQMCLTEESGFESLYSIFFFGSKISFLKEMYIEQRPRVVIAIDHLHHSSKAKRFNAVTREYIDRELARISLDCRHEIVDCSEGGDFHFVKQENYKPTVLLGDIFAFYAVDCSVFNPYEDEGRRNHVDDRNKGCIEDYKKINAYIWQKASEIPNLHIMPVNRFFSYLHRGLPYLHKFDGKLANFYKDDLFWDGFHPWSEPGAQVMANIVLEKINELILNKSLPASSTVPYIPIDGKYYKPFTGIGLVLDGKSGVSPAKKKRLISEQGKEVTFTFAYKNGAIENGLGDWEYAGVFDKEANNLSLKVGDNPLILTIEKLSANGEIILSDDQISLINRVAGNPENQLLGSVISITR